MGTHKNIDLNWWSYLSLKERIAILKTIDELRNQTTYPLLNKNEWLV